MPAERQPGGPVEEADRVRRRACAMHHIALRASPALIGFLNRRRYIQCEKCGLERDDISFAHHQAPGSLWSMIVSENRFPLFGIML
jgi:hypothetical protein